MAEAIQTLANQIANRVLGPGEVPYYLRPNEDVGLPALPSTPSTPGAEVETQPGLYPIPIAQPSLFGNKMFWLIGVIAVGSLYWARSAGTAPAPAKRRRKTKAKGKAKRKTTAKRKAPAKRKAIAKKRKAPTRSKAAAKRRPASRSRR